MGIEVIKEKGKKKKACTEHSRSEKRKRNPCYLIVQLKISGDQELRESALQVEIGFQLFQCSFIRHPVFNN